MLADIVVGIFLTQVCVLGNEILWQIDDEANTAKNHGSQQEQSPGCRHYLKCLGCYMLLHLSKVIVTTKRQMR